MLFNQDLQALLSKTKNPLVLAVGGGNDSVSTLLLQQQLQHAFSYYPDNITIVAMLPDVLDYSNFVNTPCSLVKIITPDTIRSVQGNVMTKFPEPLLSKHKKDFKSLPIKDILGILMSSGTEGVATALEYLWSTNKYDLILAIDVGGDFIAVPQNIDVLSPMMDSYMLYALHSLTAKHENIPVVYGVFGLGTDGETTPELLNTALTNLASTYEGSFDKSVLANIIHFYRDTVEPMRYSRTADFTIKEIMGETHDNPAIFRARFHVQTSAEQKSTVYYGNFEHSFNPHYFNKYYLFTDSTMINTPMVCKTANGIEWFLNVQNDQTKLNHELNGQAYMNLGSLLNIRELENNSLFFGTPSNKFAQSQQLQITEDVVKSVKNGLYTFALVYTNELEQHTNLLTTQLKNGLTLIASHENKNFLKTFSNYLMTRIPYQA